MEQPLSALTDDAVVKRLAGSTARRRVTLTVVHGLVTGVDSARRIVHVKRLSDLSTPTAAAAAVSVAVPREPSSVAAVMHGSGMPPLTCPTRSCAYRQVVDRSELGSSPQRTTPIRH